MKIHEPPRLKNHLPRNHIKRFRTGLWVYIALTFFLSYAGLFISHSLLPQQATTSLFHTYFTIFMTVTGPGLAAVLVSFWFNNTEWFSELVEMIRPRIGHLSLYILIPAMSLLCSLAIMMVTGLDTATLIHAFGREWLVLLGHLFLQVFMVGMLEEIGWRGWMLKHLCKKYNLAKATIILFPFWCLWHFPKLLGPWSVSGPFFILSLAASVILSFLWFRYRGNLFILAITHGSINYPVFFLESLSEQSYVSFSQVLDGWLLYSLCFALLALALIIRQPGIWLDEA